jgi:DNA-directed RNA polymerase subunit RPC12/RpoP
MANHEVNITCSHCSTEFDARLHGTQCPQCNKQYMFNPNKPNVMSKLFHFSDAELKVLGYTIDGYYDRNSPTDTYDTRYIKTCKKEINEDLSIEITFGYDLDEYSRHTLTDSQASLVVDGHEKPLKIQTLLQIEEFFWLIKTNLKEVA